MGNVTFSHHLQLKTYTQSAIDAFLWLLYISMSSATDATDIVLQPCDVYVDKLHERSSSLELHERSSSLAMITNAAMQEQEHNFMRPPPKDIGIVYKFSASIFEMTK